MPIATNEDQLKEKCAVFGIVGPKGNKTGLEAARLTFYGLWALQHRGQESSGIVSSDGQLHRHAAQGLVATVYREEDLEQLPGHLAIGHNRYSTSGGADDCFNQPFVDHKHKVALAHNGNLPDTTKLEAFLKQRGVNLAQKNDSAMMMAAITCYMDDGLKIADAVKQAWPLFTGAFSIVAMDAERLIAFRDECGIRPLSIGKLAGGGYAVASETCAFDTIGATFLRDVEPGELLVIEDGQLKSEQIRPSNLKLDIFEMVYFARPDSLLLGQRVDMARQDFGRQMAKEFLIEADVIVPVPDSGIPAALGYSQASGIRFEMALIKNRYIHRTFIRPTAELRERDLKIKLNPIVDLLKGQRVVLVDDSIVRGTTMRHLVQMIFEAGAKEVHLVITSPPVRHPDFYGINTPRQTELLAAYMTVPEMCEYVGATSLHFLSFEGMINATGQPASCFNNSCFNGDYPIDIGFRAKEIIKLGSGEVLPKTSYQPVELATAKTR